MQRRNERGMILLEVLLALAILGSAITLLLSLEAAAAHAVGDGRAREEQVERAHRLLGTLALLTAREYDQRLGARVVGEFRTQISRPEPGLYRIALLPIRNPRIELLVTVVFRPSQEVP